MLLVDKYRPAQLRELDLHPEVSEVLQKFVATKDFPHLLFHGPPGAGKRTRVLALLREQFGEAAQNVKLEHKTVQVNDSKSVELATLSSPHHIDINPSDAGPTYDRVVVMNTIREIASTVPLSMGAARTFKVVVLTEVDKLSRGAQQALRRTMEKYTATCRLILICNSTSRLIAPLRSRCLPVRVPGHGPEAVAQVIRGVCSKESLGEPSPQFLAAIAQSCDGNLRRALLTLEAARAARCPVTSDGTQLPAADWRVYIAEIAEDIRAEQTPKRLHEVRLKFYELLSQCVPADLILRELSLALIRAAAPTLGMTLMRHAATFDHHLKQGSKPIMHLEAFVANAMVCLKQATANR